MKQASVSLASPNKTRVIAKIVNANFCSQALMAGQTADSRGRHKFDATWKTSKLNCVLGQTRENSQQLTCEFELYLTEGKSSQAVASTRSTGQTVSNQTTILTCVYL